MSNQKTNKSFLKRLRVTRRGKVLARRPGQNHFNAKERRVNQHRKNRPAPFVMRRKELAGLLAGL